MSLPVDIVSWQPAFGDEVLELLVEPALGMATFGERLPRHEIERHVDDVWRCASAGQYLRCAAIDRTGRLVGAACIKDCALSYFVHPSLWGRGVATALASPLCRLALADGSREAVHAWVERGNRASERVLEKCRFRFAGLYRRRAGADRLQTGNRALLRYELHP